MRSGDSKSFERGCVGVLGVPSSRLESGGVEWKNMLARLLASFTPMKPQELPNRLVNPCEGVNAMQRSKLPYPTAISVMKPGANRYIKEVGSGGGVRDAEKPCGRTLPNSRALAK